MQRSILLVEDQTQFRETMRKILAVAFPGAALAEANDGPRAISWLAQLKPDVVIISNELPEPDSLEALQKGLANLPNARVMVVAADPEIADVRRAFKAGAAGLLTRDRVETELAEALRVVLAGGLYVDDPMRSLVLSDYHDALKSREAQAKPPLSERERQVLQLLVQGLRMKEVAARLNIGVRTVETYRQRLAEKIGWRDLAHLREYALRQGLVTSNLLDSEAPSGARAAADPTENSAE
jgi:DNA-binding NarL/FixJ family response regulator